MKLVLCAGDRHLPGFKHHDVKALPGIDYACDLREIDKHVPEGSCEEIHITHALEHFPTKEVPKIIEKIKGLMSDGGVLYIEVPNFRWHAILLAQGEEEKAVYYAFGGQLDEWDFHKTGFTPKILNDRLTEAGFKDIRVQDGSSLCAWAIK